MWFLKLIFQSCANPSVCTVEQRVLGAHSVLVGEGKFKCVQCVFPLNSCHANPSVCDAYISFWIPGVLIPVCVLQLVHRDLGVSNVFDAYILWAPAVLIPVCIAAGVLQWPGCPERIWCVFPPNSAVLIPVCMLQLVHCDPAVWNVLVGEGKFQCVWCVFPLSSCRANPSVCVAVGAPWPGWFQCV